MHELADQLLAQLKATWRYRWLAVVVAWIIALYGWSAVYRMPDRYEASARVWVDTQSMLKHLLYGLTAAPNPDQMVWLISRTLISQLNLEKVIRMADLDIDLKSPEDRERLVTRLTRDITIQRASGDNIFTIAYSDNDTQKAKRVVQSLLTIFEEGSRSDQQKDAEAARRFIDEELKTSKERLDAAEKVMIEFKRRQMLTAGARGDYSRVLEAQAALSNATLELKLAETSLDAIKKNLPDETEVPSLLGENNADVGVRPGIDARIQALEQKLEGLRINYTEQHPDIVAIVRTIADLREQKKQEAKLRKPFPSAAPARDPVYKQLALAVATAEANVAAAKAREAEFRNRYDELKAAAIEAPQNDADYANIARDYEMAKSSYGGLLSRRETARISREMETRASATSFRVIDPPRAPPVPKGPNRHLWNSAVLLVALGGGIGLAYVLSQIRPTFNDERRLGEVSGVQVLGTVVMAWTDAQKARKTRGLVALLISFVSLLSAYTAIMLGLVLTVSRA